MERQISRAAVGDVDAHGIGHGQADIRGFRPMHEGNSQPGLQGRPAQSGPYGQLQIRLQDMQGIEHRRRLGQVTQAVMADGRQQLHAWIWSRTSLSKGTETGRLRLRE
jgi:hypothetical protein